MEAKKELLVRARAATVCRCVDALEQECGRHGDGDARLISELADMLEAAIAEPVWEYQAKVEWIDPYDPRRIPNYYLSRRKPFTDAEMQSPVAVDDITGANTLEGCYLAAQDRRRAAGPWEPVEGENA